MHWFLLRGSTDSEFLRVVEVYGGFVWAQMS